MIVPARASFGDIDNLSDYIVRGSTGKFYGRYPTIPKVLPFDAFVDEVGPGPMITFDGLGILPKGNTGRHIFFRHHDHGHQHLIM